jgi:hypothetical protein
MDGVALATAAKIANANAASVRIVALKDVRFIRSSSPRRDKHSIGAMERI